MTAYSQVGFRYVIGDIGRTEAQVVRTGDTEFESQSQYADLSLYRSLVQKSNESEPEHSIVYVNEVMPNERVPLWQPNARRFVSKGQSQFHSLDQMRCWLGSGLHVKRLHPDLSVYDLTGLPVNGQALGKQSIYRLSVLLVDRWHGWSGAVVKVDKDDPKLLNQDDFVNLSFPARTKVVL